MKQIALIGCGNIGFRHLQAMAALPRPTAIAVIEPDTAQHDRIRAEFAAIAARDVGHELALGSALADAPSVIDLAVIATSAGPRRAILDDLLAGHRVGAVILEKVLAQSHTDLQAMADALAERAIPAFVNCPRRYFPGYQALKTDLAAQRPIHIEVRGAEFGLASNGIHFVDLAEYLNDSPVVAIDASGLTPGAVEAKRGGCVEIHGRLTARLENGAVLVIDCAKDAPVWLNLTLRAERDRIDIDEPARSLRRNEGEPAVFETRFVSQTPEIYGDLLDTGTCGLTPYADSQRQHRLFLSAVRGHLGLNEATDPLCPIS